jgi:hypothetical protein
MVVSRVALVVLFAALAMTGCVPPVVDPLPPELAAAAITREPPESVYQVTYGSDQLTVTSTAAGGNTRIVVWPRAQAASADQIACATFRSESDAINQEGVALRTRRDGARTRVITVTKNVWAGATWTFNVHTWDTSQPGVPPPRAQFPLTSLASQPFPWRLCARVAGTVVEVSAWRITGPGQDDPVWGDPERGGSVDLGPDWAAPGQPGWYAGHLKQGHTVSYGDLVARSGAS